MSAGVIEVAPLAYMRGRTLNDAFIILDEAQNTTAEQMKMFLTRLGFGSKIVVTGDITQVDLPGGANSGLRAAMRILDGIDDIHFSELTSADVVRHRLVADIVDAYAKSEEPALMNRAQRRGAERADREGERVSIEVSNESGIDVSEEELVSVARFVIAQDERASRRPNCRWCCSTPRRWPTCTCAGWTCPARPT